MTTATADYDAAVAALRTQKLPAYVEYTEQADASGMAGYHGGPHRIIVDVRKGKIVSVSPKSDDTGGDSPVTKHVFDPSCYTATREREQGWNGRTVIAISVRANTDSCKEDIDVNTVYVDPADHDLLGADGSETEDNMTVDFAVHYAKFGGYVMPTSLSAHAHGHGLLFWARERAEVRYSDYTFTDVRRQEQSP